MSKLRILQGGGRLTVSNPLTYQPTQEVDTNIENFLPSGLVTKSQSSGKSQGKKSTGGSPNIEGYPVAVDYINNQIQQIQNQMLTMPESLKSSQLPILVNQAKFLTSPAYLNRAKVNRENGIKANEVLIKDNKGGEAWLTNATGDVFVKRLIDGKLVIDAVDLLDATEGIRKGEMRPILGSEAYEVRSSQVPDMETRHGGNKIHDAMLFTKGMEKVSKELSEFKTENKQKYQEISNSLGELNVRNASGELIRNLMGEVKYDNFTESNEQNYALAIKSEENMLGKSSNAALKNHATLRLLSNKTSIPQEVLNKLNFTIDDLREDLNSDDPAAKNEARNNFNKLINLEKSYLIRDFFAPNVSVSTKESTVVTPQQWLSDRASGGSGGNTELGNVQMAYQGYGALKPVGASGKYSASVMYGRGIGTGDTHTDDGSGKFGSSNLRQISNLSEMTFGDGSKVPPSVVDNIFNVGAYVPDEQVILVDRLHINGKPVQLNAKSSKLKVALDDAIATGDRTKIDKARD